MPPPGLLQAVVPHPPPRRVVWWANDFAYHLEPGIEHHCLWLSGFDDVDSMSLERHPYVLSELRRRRPPREWEILFWENPAANRSIATVRHLQVLSRRRLNPPPRSSSRL